MKQVEVASQAIFFLQSMLLGAALGVLYDVFRILRLAFPKGKVVIFFQDLLFFGVAAVATFVFLEGTQSGEIRLFIFIGEILGFVLYYFTVGQIVFKASKSMIAFVKKLLLVLFHILIYPFVKLFGGICQYLLRPIGLFFGKILKKMGNRIKYGLKHCGHVLYNETYIKHKQKKLNRTNAGGKRKCARKQGKQKKPQKRNPNCSKR